MSTYLCWSTANNILCIYLLNYTQRHDFKMWGQWGYKNLRYLFTMLRIHQDWSPPGFLSGCMHYKSLRYWLQDLQSPLVAKSSGQQAAKKTEVLFQILHSRCLPFMSSNLSPAHLLILCILPGEHTWSLWPVNLCLSH